MALAYLPWSEVQATPPAALRDRIAALQRLHFANRADYLEDRAASNEINRGQQVEGAMPADTRSWRVVDRPYEQHLWRLRRLGDGLPVTERPDEARRRKQLENRRLASELLR
ncbi:hypothetical protein [Deinococcus depolymerans]|uniref:Uncharacterized protein n=1 Tax=Deinococcus depolymerans TaxID=392408 RepID=A0ABN1C0U3_9DEIO